MTLIAVFIASLLGSLHCTAMCGGFAAVVTGGGPGRTRWLEGAGYHTGRGLAYLALGSLAGLLGAGLDATARDWAGVHRVVGVITGLLLLAMALATLRGRTMAPTDLVAIGRRPSLLTRLRTGLVPWIRRGGPWAAFLVGAGASVLPCGWLWSYVAVAAGTTDGLRGAMVMGAFWVGTLPALGSVNWLAATVARKLAPWAPKITAGLLLLLGALSLAGRLGPLPGAVAAEHEDHEATRATLPCHGAS